MYSIHKNSNHLLVEFLDNFDHSTVKSLIQQETTLEEYPDTNDIWLIGKHHADIRLGELETMVSEFQCLCPTDSSRTKTAVVVTQGHTCGLIELWTKALRKRVNFEIEIFHTLEAAELWLGVSMRAAS